ncbi:unnamed protein product [Dimorphilus gyrociliatus]|uniref:Uncharacterized protein n=1 Tax=Dimorphilus gyrociliatus TaxID=2664684 RepID=A0A7I8W9K1_9ANNE|nr:unnamed protein product [Dimorphilus gyrociliatus]
MPRIDTQKTGGRNFEEGKRQLLTRNKSDCGLSSPENDNELFINKHGQQRRVSYCTTVSLCGEGPLQFAHIKDEEEVRYSIIKNH